MKEKKEGKAAFLGGTGGQGNAIALYIFWLVSLIRLEKASLDIYACRKEGNGVWDKDQLLILFWRVAEIKGKRSLLASIFSLESE